MAEPSLLYPLVVVSIVAGLSLAGCAVLALRHRTERRRISAALSALGGSDADPVRASRRAAQEALRLDSALNELRAIIETAPVGIVSLDHLGRIATINPAAERILDCAGRPAAGRLLIELARSPELDALVAAARETGRRADAELAFQSAAGGRTVRCALVPITSGNAASLLVMEDLTELRRLEAMRTDFVANVSHELRTPITTIRGYAETLTDGFELEPAAERFIDIIHRSSIRLGAIIDDLLLLSSLEDHDALRRTGTARFTLRAAAADAIEHHAVAARAKLITVEPQLEADAAIAGDLGLVSHAVGNLLSNAIKYSPERTTVRVRVRRDGEEAVVEVSDQGPGIPEQHRERLFERFYRVDKARSRDSGGTGLGLSIVKHVALVHRGHAEVDSTVGAGSTFRLRFPVAESPGQGPERTP
jgi:two-component system phosphate regulon sensor histidine kinase PhoR